MTQRRTPPTRTSPSRRTTGLRAAVSAAGVAVSVIVVACTPALAAPPSTFEMSSFVADVSGDDVVGGVRTVTVVNPNDHAVHATMWLGDPPCDCVVDSSAPSRGTQVGDSWDVGELGPGESATLTVRYVTTPEAAVGVPGGGASDEVPWRRALAGIAIVACPVAVARAISAGDAPILRGSRHRRAAVA